MKTILGILVIAAVATVCDATWYAFGVRNMVVTGVVYGVVLLAVVGAVLGAVSGRLVKGLPIGAVAGVAGALCYYAIVAAFGRRAFGYAIPVSWVFMWFVLAALDGRWLRAPARRSWGAVVTRGMTASLFGALAFYLVMNTLWGRPPEGGRNYAMQFLAWALAWAPGIFALSFGSGSEAPRPAPMRPRETSSARTATPAGTETDDVSEMEGSITSVALLERIDRGESLRILDVRSEGEFAAGHVPGAVNIPFNQVGSRMSEVPGTDDEPLVLYCGHGPRAYIAAPTLRHRGRKIVYMTGHFSGWEAAGLRVER